MLVVDRLNVEYPSKHGPAVTALGEVTMSIAPGEFVVALGASGCGKTTLLNAIAGFVQPTSGSISLHGKPVRAPGKERGVVFQKHALMPWLSVLENVEFGLKMQGMPLIDRRRIAMESLRKVGLSRATHQAVYELSGGMQQRVGVARAIATSPQVMLLDEPLGALDAFIRESIQELLLDLWIDSDRMFFFITHDVEEALFLATRLVIMAPRPGRIEREFNPVFSRRYAQSRDARGVKAAPEFIAMREEILQIVRETAAESLQ